MLPATSDEYVLFLFDSRSSERRVAQTGPIPRMLGPTRQEVVSRVSSGVQRTAQESQPALL